MKKITIFQENQSPIIIDDINSDNIETYTNGLSNIFNSANVSILHTSSCSAIIRPSKIISIVVKDYPTEPQNQNKQNIEAEKLEQNNENDDIITD